MPAIRIVKVGGSLFDWPMLPPALNAWLSEQPSAINVLVAGGGGLVDAIRQASNTFSLDDEVAHWLCIEAMSVQSRLLASMLANTSLISTYDGLRSTTETGSCTRVVFNTNEFLHEHESRLPGNVLPHDWSVTSDSIAARVAEVLEADELVLMKSAYPSGETTQALANAGFVDRNFPSFDGGSFRQRFVNLRDIANCRAASEI